MKISWGTGIAIFYSCFVIVMVGMVVKSTFNRSDLVIEDYYNQDLGYEEFRQSRRNALELKEKVNIDYLDDKKEVIIKFPEDMKKLKGEVLIFRPSNKFLDTRHPIALDVNNTMRVPIARETARGLWKVKVSFSDRNHNYYLEESVVF